MGPGVRRDDSVNARFSEHSSRRNQTLSPHHSSCTEREGDVMERRHFLKLAVGFAAGATALAASAEAAPLSPQLPLARDERSPAASEDLHPAVTTEAEVERLK